MRFYERRFAMQRDASIVKRSAAIPVIARRRSFPSRNSSYQKLSPTGSAIGNATMAPSVFSVLLFNLGYGKVNEFEPSQVIVSVFVSPAKAALRIQSYLLDAALTLPATPPVEKECVPCRVMLSGGVAPRKKMVTVSAAVFWALVPPVVTLRLMA